MHETQARDIYGGHLGMTDGYASTAAGWISFAGVMLIMTGIFQATSGIVGIADDDLVIKTKNYAFALDTTQWGWIHLTLGVLILLAGIGLFTGNILARIVGVTLASLSAIANFLYLPHYPIWSVVVIAMDVAVIWALTAHGRDITLPN
jgi:hypothetical protein